MSVYNDLTTYYYYNVRANHCLCTKCNIYSINFSMLFSFSVHFARYEYSVVALLTQYSLLVIYGTFGYFNISKNLDNCYALNQSMIEGGFIFDCISNQNWSYPEDVFILFIYINTTWSLYLSLSFKSISTAISYCW